MQFHAGLAVGTNKFSNTVTADEVNGSNRRRFPALWAGSIKRLKVTMMACSAPLSLSVTLEQRDRVAADRLALWCVAFNVNSHMRRQHRTQRGSANRIDALIT